MGQFGILSTLDIETITTDKGARLKKEAPKIDLLALQQLEICKSELQKASTPRKIVRFERLIASFLAFFKTNRFY